MDESNENQDNGPDSADESAAQDQLNPPAQPPPTTSQQSPVGVDRYRAADGSYDIAGMLKELERLEERVIGLRKKVTVEPKNGEIFDADDPELRKVLGELGGDGTADVVLRALSGAGMGKQSALKFLQLVGENLAPPPDEKTLYREELAKLGEDPERVLKPLRIFRKSMEEAGWTAEELAAFDRQTTTAEGVTILSKVLQSGDKLRSGRFSPFQPESSLAKDSSPQEKFSAYSKAYALMRTDPVSARAELKRLQSLWE